MSKTSERLKLLMQEKNVDINTLSEKIEIKLSKLQKYLNGDTEKMKNESNNSF
jgi:predicted transcriptional regulator